MVNIDNITDAEWRKPSNIAQHKVMRDKINEVITVVNEGGGGGGGTVPSELVADVATLKTDMVTVQAELNAINDGITNVQNEVALKADKTEVTLKADKTYVDDKIIEILFGLPIDCSVLLTMYKSDATLVCTPIINAENCTSLRNVFKNCSKLTTVGGIHCPNVTNMSYMFYGCTSLKTIPSLDTSKVTDMVYMFSGCTSLKTIPLLDTSKVTNMVYMFYGCTSLTSVTFQCVDVRPYGIQMFNATPIASGNGRIYVPDSLVQAYKTASGWSTHASVIYGHSAKP